MVTKEELEKVVFESGLWDRGRNLTHGFLLSPSVYELGGEQYERLKVLGVALQETLAGLGRLAAIAANPKLSYGHTWSGLAKLSGLGIPNTYQDLQGVEPGRVPALCKVDLMESRSGGFFIAEIDGHNKHGLGYSTLAARLRKASVPDAAGLPGVAKFLANFVMKKGRDALLLLYAEQERFYLPEFQVLAQELALLDVKLVVASENQVSVREGALMVQGEEDKFDLLVDFPFLKTNHALGQFLAEGYWERQLGFVIPPKPFLGSKVVLALVRNEEGDPELEAILRSQIKASALTCVREHIPPTYLVSKGRELDIREDGRYVLKEVISSGMKGTIFPDDPRFGQAMALARKSYGQFVLQEEVENAPKQFHYFDQEGNLQQDTWFMRVTVHLSLREIADIVVTARQDKKVHGALDCLQLGTVLV